MQRSEQPLQKRSSRGNTGEQAALAHPQRGEKSGPLPRLNVYPEDDGLDTPRQPTSAVPLGYPRMTSPQRLTGSQPLNAFVPPRRQQRAVRNLRRPLGVTQPYERATDRKNVHWLLPLGVGVIATIVLWMFGISALAWANQRYNDLHYGNPRTYQTDAYVGHHESPGHPSHFIAVNLNRQVIVVEFMGGDPSKSVSYVAPVYIDGDGGNLAPVTVEFRDVNGDQKPDMIIHIHLPTQDQPVVFLNDGGRFRPSNGSDKIHL